MRLGVFGGTFDPPHIAHLIVAQDAHRALALDRVLFIPAARPPHKREQPLTDASVRLEMLRAAVDHDERFEIRDVELGREGPSYTVDTLRELKRSDPDGELFLLIGSDQWLEFGTWHDPDGVRALARVIVLSREGHGGGGAPDSGRPDGIVRVTRLDVSSTMIRDRVAAGAAVRYLVPVGVEEIIRRERLYLKGEA